MESRASGEVRNDAAGRPPYASVVDQTPHLRYRTPHWLMALALLFAALLALAIFRLALG